MTCPYAGVCGGCSLLDVPYSQQLAAKQKRTEELLLSLNPSASVSDPVYGPEFGYRSRARFRYSKEGLSFFEEKSNNGVLLKTCPVLDSLLNAFVQNPPKLNIWELEDAQLSCISTDKKVVFGQEMGWVTVKDRKLPVAGDVFFQSNRILLPNLIDFVRENTDGMNVMDLYAGVGTFSAFLEDDHNVTAVEINRRCLSLARQHLKKTEFFASPVEKWNPKRRKVDTIIVDPPRTGLDRKVPDMLASFNPKTIIYISCYQPTLQRDLYRLKDLGYEVIKGGLYDFYPQTPHIETVVCMINQNAQAKHHVNVGIDAEEYYRIKGK